MQSTVLDERKRRAANVGIDPGALAEVTETLAAFLMPNADAARRL
ncbi:hypothetical protein [Hyphomicrobium sp. CS1BSMeth3]|nr:hypothetical protein [Hyphomicrobium sp. CS1BSMeth3]